MKNLKDDIELVERKISYWFKTPSLLEQAFTRSSYTASNGGNNNEIFEFIGDKVLDYYVIKIIMDRYGYLRLSDNEKEEFIVNNHQNEGSLTELKKNIISNQTLAERIDELELIDYLIIGESDVDNNVKNEVKIKADLFEAILGAIAIDSDWDTYALENSVDFMLEIDKFLVDEVDTTIPQKFYYGEYVTCLKELGEKGFCSIPHYELSTGMSENSQGIKVWSCTCTIKNLSLTRVGTGQTKQLAKKNAAYKILCYIYGIKEEKRRFY